MRTDTSRNTIYLRRRSKIILPVGTDELLPINYVAAAVKNIESLGYGFSERLIAACRSLTMEQLVTVYQELVADLKTVRGAHHPFKPMYPNFPAQVMEMSQGELYLNAIIHYWTGGKLFPRTDIKERLPLLDNVELTLIDLGTIADFEALFGQIAGSNASLSEQDKQDLEWFVEEYRDHISALLPSAIPQKENVAFVASLLLKHTGRNYAVELIGKFVKTATDVLRLTVALSGGDLSLATATKFRTFSRPERHLILALLEQMPNVVEDMLRWKGRWVRLGEKLHPGEHMRKYEKVGKAFAILRNDEPFTTFNGQVEKALAAKNVESAVALLVTRPGDFARRLDHLLRIDNNTQDTVVVSFAQVAQKVATPVLLQVINHLAVRNGRSVPRVFFPKGNLAKAHAVANTLPILDGVVSGRLSTLCEDALKARFAALPTLGRVYVDPKLSDYLVPFAMRSTSKSLRTLVRGSKLPLPDGDILRFFVWWKNGTDRTDIDLSATLFNEDFDYADILSYYNLARFGGVHSGDIVDAPEGASEFIDVSLETMQEEDVRYIVMTLHSYTQQPYVDLPECFAGWMVRQQAGSGEIFEPKTVQDRLDLTADTRIAIPLVIDVFDRKIIWCDMALRNDPEWQNNVHGSLSGIHVTLRMLVDLNKPNLYDLLMLHGQARGVIVDDPEDADTVFSVENDTPFRLEQIASEYMA